MRRMYMFTSSTAVRYLAFIALVISAMVAVPRSNSASRLLRLVALVPFVALAASADVASSTVATSLALSWPSDGSPLSIRLITPMTVVDSQPPLRRVHFVIELPPLHRGLGQPASQIAKSKSHAIRLDASPQFTARERGAACARKRQRDDGK
jgi:hypothetical protein